MKTMLVRYQDRSVIYVFDRPPENNVFEKQITPIRSSKIIHNSIPQFDTGKLLETNASAYLYMMWTTLASPILITVCYLIPYLISYNSAFFVIINLLLTQPPKL